MREFALVLLVSAFLLLAGCASQQAPPAQPTPPASGGVVITPPPAVEENETTNQTNSSTAEPPPALANPDSCTVQFQKDASSVYYVMVQTSSAKPVTVTCPDGQPAEKQGELYFCERLDVDSDAIAYLDGVECGKLNFQQAALQSIQTGPTKCTILASHKKITVGQTSEITVQTSTGGTQVELTFNCGAEIEKQRRSGLETDGATCTYNTPGTVVVEAKLDGATCDTEVLEVFEQAKDCFVTDSKLEMVKGDYVYTAKVSGRGYSGSDKLKYRCFGIPHEVMLSTIPTPADFVETIECRGKTALVEPVGVTIASTVCGSLVPPA